jgi:hypothetical protein
MADAGVSSTKVAGLGFGERLRRAARAGVREAGAAFGRTPLEVLLGVCAAVGLSVAVERNAMDTWVRLLVAVGLALPLTYAASVLHARGIVPAWVRWAVSGAAVVFGALWGFLGPDNPPVAEIWRTWLLVLTGVAALLCVPLVGAGGDERRARVYAFVARLVARTAIVGAYAAALWVGLALALAAVNGLFELHLPGKAWVHLTAALFVLLPPWAIAAGLPVLIAPTAPWGEDALRVLRRIGLFLATPLVIVYLGIVYAYTIRVMATGEVPKNLVSPVVIGAGLLIVATTFALEPAQGDTRAGGLALFVRLAGPLLLPLVLFAIWAVTTRVDQYGWTEFRYLRLLLLVLLAAFAAAAVYRLVRRRRPPLTAMPAVLGVVLLLAAVGPVSAPAVAHRSQAGELQALLAQAHRRGPGGTAMSVPSPVFRGIVDKSDYLQEHFGWAALAQVIPWIGKRPPGRIATDLLAQRIGVVEAIGGSGSRVVDASVQGGKGIPGVPGGTFWEFEARAPQEPPRAGKAAGKPAPPARVTPPHDADQVVVIVGAPPARVLVLRAGGDTLTAAVVPLLDTLLARSATHAGQPYFGEPRPGLPPEARGTRVAVDLLPAEAVRPLLARDGHVAGQLVLRHITFESTSAAARGARPSDAAGHLLRVEEASGFIVLPAAPAAPAP